MNRDARHAVGRSRGRGRTVLEELKTLRAPFAICFEASTGYGYLCERLQGMARRVVVAHPGHLRLIFRSTRKNDRVDAEKLAKLLFLDEVPPRARAGRGCAGLASPD